MLRGGHSTEAIWQFEPGVREETSNGPESGARDMLQNVQVLRALAALMVVFAHCEVALQPLGVAKQWSDSFASGVDLFFMISGFVMVYTTSSSPPTSFDFLKNRVARVVPLYWVLTLCTFLLALSAPSLMGATKVNFGALAKSLAFIPYTREDGTMRPVLFLGWSLNYEMFFYLLFAAGLLVRNLALRLSLVVGCLVALVISGVLWGGTLTPELGFLTRPIILQFAVGMLLAVLFPTLPKSAGAGKLAAVAAAVAAPMLVVFPALFPGVWLPAMLPGAVLLIATLIMQRAGLVLRFAPVLLLGDASYSLYLTHPFISQGLTKSALVLGALSPVKSLALVVAIFVMACACAVICFRYLEQPLSRAARKAFGVARSKRMAAAKASPVS